MEPVVLLVVAVALLWGKGGKKDKPHVVVNIPKFPKEPEDPDPGQPDPPKGPGALGELDPPDEPLPDPVEPIDDWTDIYPKPGTFYQVVKDDTPLGVAKKALLSAGYMAAAEVGGLDHGAASAFANKVAASGTRQYKFLNMMQCSGWNDVLYETYGFGTQAHESPNGRALRFIPQHANNRARLRNGLAPIRNIAIGKPSDQGKGNRIGVDPALRQGFEFLWLPAVNLDTLWESDGETVTPDELVWDDGSPQTLPPPWVMALGIEDASGVTVKKFGCGLGEWEFG